MIHKYMNMKYSELFGCIYGNAGAYAGFLRGGAQL